MIGLFIMLGTVLPTSDGRKRAWIFRSFRTDFRRALCKPQLRRDPDALAFRDADRLGQLGALQSDRPEDHAADLCGGLHMAALTSGAWDVRLALGDPQIPSSVERQGRAALAAEDPDALRRAANQALAAGSETSGGDRKQRRWAAATLVRMATLIERSPREITALNGGGGR